MRDLQLLIHLETPFIHYVPAVAPARDVLVAGLKWSTSYWVGLAVNWVEQGAPIDEEIAAMLDMIAKTKHFPQALRHKSFAIARRWEKAN
jgi:hypothetical protein